MAVQRVFDDPALDVEDPGDGEGVAQQDGALNDPLWQSLSAVQGGGGDAVDDVIWNTAGGILAAHLMLDDIASIYGVAQN